MEIKNISLYELRKMNGECKMLSYNGLVVLEADNLGDYDVATALRNEAARLPYTTLAFVGATGRSVKIVCRGELFPDGSGRSLPENETEIQQFHRNLY